MRSVVLFGMFVILTANRTALAQTEVPRAELFGGFSYLPADASDFPRGNSSGVQFSLCGNINRWLGIVGDFGGQFGTSSDLGPNWPGVTVKTSVYEYFVGPRFSIRRKRFNLFFHALAGGAQGNSGLAGFSDSAFALAAGGGLDINVNHRFAVRAIQLDYIGSFVDILENNVRLGFGVVFKPGRSK